VAPRYAVSVLALALLGACAAVQATGLEAALPLYQEGVVALDEGDLTRAIGCFTDALRVHPIYADALYRRGSARLKLVLQGDATLESQEIEKAIEDLGRALTLYPLHFEAAYNRALALAALGRYRETARDLDLVLQSPDVELKREAHLKLGLIYEEKFEDMQPQAVRHYEKYLELGGKETQAFERIVALRNRANEISARKDGTRDADGAFFDAVDAAERGEKKRAVERLESALPRLGEGKRDLATSMIAQWKRELESEESAGALVREARKLIAEGKRDLGIELLRRVVVEYGQTKSAATAASMLKAPDEKK
jgi:tetratricopeptide (TPR) repeat protein